MAEDVEKDLSVLKVKIWRQKSIKKPYWHQSIRQPRLSIGPKYRGVGKTKESIK